MTKSSSSTAEQILDVAEELMQTGGYNAFSFGHIADRVGIKKPSIIHHFPNKEALGKAVVKRYRESFGSAFNSIANDPNKTALEIFDFYCTPYRDFGASNDKICLCGALAGEFMALPQDVKDEITTFCNENIEWLEGLLKRGKKNAEFDFSDKPIVFAKMIFNTLQGALMIKRATNDNDQIEQNIALLKSKLSGKL